MSITSVVRSLSDFTLIRGLRDLSSDSEMTVNIPRGIESPLAGADPYFLGCQFHALLKRVSDRGRLSNQEELLLPWLSALRTTFREMGVGKLDPLVRFRDAHGVPRGAPDLVAAGGPRAQGVIELKVVKLLPVRPDHEHLLQLGGYAAHLACTPRFHDPWACVVYASFREAKLRFFIYADTRSLIRKSRALYKSAA